MKVIKHGEVIRFVCPVCSCEFMAREEETYKKPDEPEYFAVCPDCGESDIPGEKQEFSPVVEAQAEEQPEEKKTEEKIKGRLLKAFKAVNSISGKSLTEADIKRQRAALERAGKLAAHTSDILARPFTLGDLHCQEFTPEFAHNPKYVVMYAHGGGYICGGLDYARILSAKLAIATGFTTYSYL